MLIRKAILDQIKAGAVTLAFRRWRRATVRSGGTLVTSVGVLAIRRVEPTTLRAITERDARRAGYGSRDALISELGAREGRWFKITLAYTGDDPRKALRDDHELSHVESAEIIGRLRRMDARSAAGSWTQRVLTLIEKHPMLPAQTLADNAGVEKEWLKTNVRKLKNLGLTISHQPGYTLSRRGGVVLKRMQTILQKRGTP